MIDTPKVIDNFLPLDIFPDFAHGAMNAPLYIPCDFTATKDEKDGSIDTFGMNLSDVKKKHETMFQAMIQNRTLSGEYISDFYAYHEDAIDKIKNLLNIKTLYVLRVNVTQGQDVKHQGEFHTDRKGSYLEKNLKVAILYLNSNDGGTLFRDDSFIESTANRCVTFPMGVEHAGVWCTNAKLRYVLNINYEEN